MICNISEICSSLLVEQMGTALDAANRLPKTVKRIALNQAAGKVAVRVPSNCGVARVGIDFDLLFSHDLVCTGKVSFWPIPAAGRILPRPAAPGRARRFADRAMLGTAATRVQWRVDERTVSFRNRQRDRSGPWRRDGTPVLARGGDESDFPIPEFARIREQSSGLAHELRAAFLRGLRQRPAMHDSP
jgi:hypothetical protein